MPAKTSESVVKISWRDLQRDCQALARRLQILPPFQGIVVVTRGGLIPAALLARQLELRLIDTVCVISYDPQNQRVEPPLILKTIQGDGAGWLIIDDLVDSGETLRSLRKVLPGAHFATVYAKPKGAAWVDSCLKTVPQEHWLVFPWEEEPD